MSVLRFVYGMVALPFMAVAGAVVGVVLAARWAVGKKPEVKWVRQPAPSPTPEDVVAELAKMIDGMRQAKRN